MAEPSESYRAPREASGTRAPYRAPVLRVFGPIALVTQAMNMTSANKDGGSNNTKSA
jgi:hypothetical protein